MTTTNQLTYDITAEYELTERDIEFRNVGGLSLKVRIYEPKGAGPFPMLVDLHGGGFGRFDRTRDAPIMREIARHGMVVGSIDFRHQDEGPFPAAQEAIDFGIRWLKAHAADFNARTEGFGGIGFSWGGHHILIAGMRPDDPRYRAADAPAADAALAYVISCGCGFNLIEAGDFGDMHGYFGSFAGIKKESPQHILESDEDVKMPPLLIMQAEQDHLEGFQLPNAAKLAQTYGERGGFVELAIWAGAPHIFLNSDAAEPTEAMVRGLPTLTSYIARQWAYMNKPFTG